MSSATRCNPGFAAMRAGLIDAYRAQDVRIDIGTPVRWNLKGRFGARVAA